MLMMAISLFSALHHSYKKQIYFHQIHFSNTPLLQPVPPKSFPWLDEGGYSMAFIYGIANLL